MFKELMQVLQKAGISEGDNVYIASDVTLLLCEAFKHGVKTMKARNEYLNELINTFQQAVGNKGTLLFPIFSWDFCRGKAFNINESLGEVGSLNNWILQNRPDFVRTRHPLYSFLVWGQNAPLLAALDNIDAWGKDSPFAYLHYHGGKMLLFNVSLQRGFTFMHYVEQSVNVPYRYTKAFSGDYIDAEGQKNKRVYNMYVRDLSINSEEYLPEDFLLSSGAMWEYKIGGQSLGIIDLGKAYDIVADNLLNNNGCYCYKFTDYKIDWSKGATHEDDFSNRLP